MFGFRSEVLPEVVGGTPLVAHPGHPGRDAARGLVSVQVVTGHVRARSEAQRSAAVCLSMSAAALFECVRTECVAPRATAYGACVGPNLQFLSLSYAYGITAGSLTRTLRGQP